MYRPVEWVMQCMFEVSMKYEVFLLVYLLYMIKDVSMVSNEVLLPMEQNQIVLV